MKILYLSIIIAISTHSLFAQDKKFTVGLEMSLSLSGTTNAHGNVTDYGMRLSQNLFLKSGYHLTRDMEVTLGCGLLNTRQFEAVEFFPDVDRIEFDRSHNFVVIPVGVKYHFGSFYIHPEIGLGVDAGHPTRQYTYTRTIEPNSVSVSTIVQQYNASAEVFGYRKYSVPLFLGVGTEFDLGAVSLLLGVKGYYSMTTLKENNFVVPEHYYGVGVVTGVKF